MTEAKKAALRGGNVFIGDEQSPAMARYPSKRVQTLYLSSTTPDP